MARVIGDTPTPAFAALMAEECRNLLEKLVAAFPAEMHYKVRLGGALCNRGIVGYETGNSEGAVHWLADAIRILESVNTGDERNTTAKRFLRNSHGARARALGQLGRHREAVADWERVISLDPQMPYSVAIERARTLALAGDHANATKETLLLATPDQTSGAKLYDAARVFSLSSSFAECDETIPVERRRELAAEYADKAVELLGRARQVGYFNDAEKVRQMEKSSDLDPIRKREDFQQSLQEPAEEAEGP